MNNLQGYTDLLNELGMEDKQLSDYSSNQANKLKSIVNGRFMILTAENPNAKQLSNKENEKLNNQLRSQLISEGLEFYELSGDYEGTEENSFLVANVSIRKALQLCKKYNQESVIVNEGLLYQNGSYYKNEGLEINDNLQENYSVFNDVIKFNFNLDFSTTLNM